MMVGQLTIEMAANVARLRQDMDAAKRTVSSAMADIQKSVDVAKKAMGVLIGVGSVAAFSGLIKGAIESAAALHDLSIQTGASVESLSAFAAIGKYSNQSAESIAMAMNRLAKGMSGVTDEGKGAAAALAAVGLDFKSFSRLNADEQMMTLAKAMNNFQDGSGKAAVAMALLGKEGAKMLPFLKDLADVGEIQAKVTAEQAAASDNFDDNLKKISASSAAWSKELSMGMVPALNVASQAFIDVMNGSGGVRESIRKLSADGTIQAWTETAITGLTYVSDALTYVWRTVKGVATGIGGLTAAMVAAMSGDFRGAGVILKEASADITSSFSEETIGQALRKRMAEIKALGDESEKAKPKVNFTAVLEADKEAMKALAKWEKELAEARVNAFKLELKAIEAQQESTDKVAEGNQKLREEIALIGADEFKRAQLLKTKELEIIATKELDLAMAQNADASAAIIMELQREIRLRKERLGLIDEKAVAEANNKIRKEEADAWQKHWEQVGQSLTDALMQGGRSAADYLKGLFRSMVLKPILQPIVGGALAALGLGGSSAAMASQTPGTMSSALGLGNTIASIKSVYNTVTGGFASLGDSVAFAAQDIGEWLTMNTTGILNEAGSSLMTNAGAIGTGASYLGGAAVGYGAGRLISGQYSVGGNSNTAVVGGTLVGAIVGGPLGAAIGGAVGGVINRAFGMGSQDTQDVGLSGSFGASGANVQAFRRWHQDGGWFRSDRNGTDMSAIGNELQTTLDVALRDTASTVKQYVGLLGMSADAVDGYSEQINLSLMNMSAEQQQKAIADALSKFGDNMVSTLYAQVTSVARTGETAGQTLSRLASSIKNVNSVFDVLNITLMDASVSGADAASALIDMFGGVEAFVQSTNFYYENFYSQAERTAKTTEQIAEAMTALGMAMPTTRAEFRALVEAARAAGNNELFARLMSLAPAFASITTEVAVLDGTLQTLKDTLKTAQSATDSAMDALKTSIANAANVAEAAITSAYNALVATLKLQRDAADAARQVAGENVTTIRGVFDLLKTQIAQLVGEAGAGMTAAQGSAFIDQALATARATGYLPDQSQLSDAITAARSGLTSGNYASAFELRRDRLILAGRLTDLQGVAGDQLSIAERQLQAAEDTVTRLDDQINRARTQYETDLAQNKAFYDAQLAAAQAQINALRGIDTTVLDLADAMRVFAEAIRNEVSATGALTARTGGTEQWVTNSNGQTNWVSTGGAVGTLGANGGINITTPAGYNFTAQDVVDFVINSIYSPMDIYSAAIANGISGNSLDAIMGWDIGSSNAWAASQGLPAFAAGGLHDGGARLVGENGPELEVTGPARYYSASDTASMMGGGDVAVEVRQLREDNKAQALAMVQLQSRVTRLLERWDGDGLPETRSVA